MKKPLLIVVALLVLAPFAWLLLDILVPQVRPEPSPEDLFLRLTGRTELPQSVSELKGYVIADPLLGDGTAIISFSISASEGAKLVHGITFAPGSRYGTRPMPITIDNPESGDYRVGFREGFVTTNVERTVILWAGGI